MNRISHRRIGKKKEKKKPAVNYKVISFKICSPNILIATKNNVICGNLHTLHYISRQHLQKRKFHTENKRFFSSPYISFTSTYTFDAYVSKHIIN